MIFTLEHRIEVDSTKRIDHADATGPLKLTYNKICPCTINGQKQEVVLAHQHLLFCRVDLFVPQAVRKMDCGQSAWR